uniref:Epidermal patterning factor-like protein n=1 Tax=Panagrellus redivivus TaxID=6233 RepID=A0A7E4ZY80_PANRE
MQHLFHPSHSADWVMASNLPKSDPYFDWPIGNILKAAPKPCPSNCSGCEAPDCSYMDYLKVCHQRYRRGYRSICQSVAAENSRPAS